MPDSLFALVLLALVGVPGYVYTALRRTSVGPTAPVPDAGGNLETIFFGLPCAIGGLGLSLVSQQDEWERLLGEWDSDDADALAEVMASEGLRIALAAFLGALVTALLLAGLVRLLSALRPATREDRKGRVALAMAAVEKRPWLQAALMVLAALVLAALVAYGVVPGMRIGD